MGFEVSYEVEEGKYKPRNYCVQYRESDFDFASRLMEEEGIYYYFDHTDGKNKLVIADRPQSHRPCPAKSDIPFALKVADEEDFVTSIKKWQNDHQLQSGKVSFWDFNFQLPSNKLDATQPTLFSVADNQKLEIYDSPGGYARKVDGIDRAGGEQASSLQSVFEDKTRKAEIVMQSIDSQYRVISGNSDCSALTSGYRFKFFNHPTADQNGEYVLTSVTHEAEQNPTYTTDDDIEKPYNNSFTCIAYGKGAPPFRPPQKTRKPTIQGSQTAMVVGLSGEEISTDKYGRVKVQFHWDREGQDDLDSSCWVRVAQAWAGNGWGAMFIPRIGMEVIVHFLEGDPDNPIITGCVYNPSTMPPYKLPDHKTKMTIKSNSTTGGGGFNEFRFEDKKGKEQIFLHGQKDQDIRIKNTRRELIGNDRHLIVYRDKREQVKRDKHTIIERDQIELIKRDFHLKIKGKVATETTGSVSNKISQGVTEEVGANYSVKAGGVYTIKAPTIVLDADTAITLKVGGNFVTVNSAGVQINGTMVLINSGGAAVPGAPGTLVPPLDPDEAEIADNADPGSKSPTYRNQRAQIPHPKIPTYTKPSHKPDNPNNQNKKSWIALKLVDEEGNGVPGQRYRVTLTDGTTIAEGTTDETGFAKVPNIDPGSCKITFPTLDRDAWTEL